MSQQINLLDESLCPKREWLTLNNLGFGVLATVLALAAAAGMGWLQEAREMQRFKAAEAQLKLAQEQLTVLAGEQGRRRIDPKLEAEVSDAKRILQGKHEVMAILERGGLGDREGFSRYLQGFARQAIDGVWITGFDLVAGGRSLEIRGRMRQEALLPVYVARLNQEPAFQGRRFAALDMRRVDPAKPGTAPGTAVAGDGGAKPAYIEFVLAGDAPKPAAASQ